MLLGIRYDTGTIGGVIAMGDWLKVFGTFQLDLPPNIGVDNYFLLTNRKSLVVSILSAGTFVGALLAFPMGDLVGRKWGIVASCAIFSLGVGLQLDTHWSTFIVGRVIAGIGVVCGGVFVSIICNCSSSSSFRVSFHAMYQSQVTFFFHPHRKPPELVLVSSFSAP